MGHILIADDHPMCRKATRMALASLAVSHDFVEAKDQAEAFDNAEGADLILLDLMLPDSLGLAGLLTLSSQPGGAPVIVVTGREGEQIIELVRAAGASGFVNKDAELEELALAAVAVLAGKSWFPESSDTEGADEDAAPSLGVRLGELTMAERRVLAALSDGSLNKQIANRLDISEITVKQHIKSILRKTGALNRTQAALLIQLYDDQEKMRKSFETASVADVSEAD